MSNSLPTPKRAFKDGETVDAASSSSDKVYKCKRVDDHYTCNCPAWSFQKGVPTDARTCKHLKTLLGESYETARIAMKLGPGGGKSAAGKGGATQQKRSASTSASASTAKKAKTVSTNAQKAIDEDGTLSDEADAGGKKKIEVLLAKSFELGGGKDPKGWWVSEKLDGIRAYWDGQGRLYSRLGNPFHAPAWFINKLPKAHTLDGELFHSRNNFSAASSIVRSHSSEKWNEIRYKVFDIPSLAHLPFESRLDKLRDLFPIEDSQAALEESAKQADRSRNVPEKIVGGSEYKWIKGPVVDIVEQTVCRGMGELVEMLREVEQEGGEGLMLREPKSLYVGKRSGTLLKVKTFFDAEARVTGYEPGKGKYKGITGSLVCEMECGKTFSCGSGLTDAQRVNPPKVGAIVNYRFQEVTKDGVPRFPTFVGETVDKIGPKDADVSSKTVKKKSSGSEGD